MIYENIFVWLFVYPDFIWVKTFDNDHGIMRFTSAKSQSVKGASHQHLPSHHLAWLLVTRICPVYLVDELSPCVLWPLFIELMVFLFDVFLDGKYGFTSMGSWCYSREWGWNLRTKLCCIASGKWNVSRFSLQGLDVSYLMF